MHLPCRGSVRHAGARGGAALVSVVAAGLAGCASAAPQGGDPHAPCREELARREDARGQVEADLRRQADQAAERADLLERELARVAREVEAARERGAAQAAAIDAATARLAAQERELAGLREEAGARPPEGEAAEAMAAALLRRKDAELKALRERLAALAAADPSAPRAPSPYDGVVQRSNVDLEAPVAAVDGEPLTRREFVEFLYRDLATPSLLELFVNRHLVLREARARDVAITATEEAMWSESELLRQVRQAGSVDEFKRRVAEMGFDQAAWEARLRYQARAALSLQKLIALDRTTPAGREAFEARLRETWVEQYGERVTARHVFVAVPQGAPAAEVEAARRKAEAARDEARRGVPFADVARRRSEDRETARAGGALGTFDRRKFAAQDALNTALFTLPLGAPSDPIRSQLGFHIVLVDERTAPKRPWDEALRRELAARLAEEPPSQAEVDALVARLRGRSTIHVTLAFD